MVAGGEQVQEADLLTPQNLSSGEPVSRDRVDALIKEHYSGLLVLLLRSTRNTATAADIVNDAIATSLEHLRTGRIAQPEQIAGYIYQVALNHLRNRRRKMDERTDRRVDAETLESVASDQAAPDVLAESAIVDQVRRVIEELPTERDRLIVKRFYLDEEDKDRLCKELGISFLHFDKVIFRARQRMRALLQKHGFKRTDFFSILCVV